MFIVEYKKFIMTHTKNFRLDAKSIFLTIPQISSSNNEEANDIQKTAYNRVMEHFKDKLDYLIVSLENHKDGGYHLHILIVLLKRFTTTKMDYFDFIADKHPNVQSARNVRDVIKYVIKDGNFLSYNIDPKDYLKEVENKVKVASKGVFYEVAEAIKKGENIAQLNERFSGVFLKNSKQIMEYIKLMKQIKNDEISKEYYENIYKNVVWKPFQETILNIISSSPNARKINWFYNKLGNSGKSFLSTYLSIYRDAYIINGGKEQDIYYNYNGQPIVIFDLARDAPMVAFDSIYRTMENFKNGYFLSTKYEGGCKRFIPPHIIVFSNELPNFEKMSSDRWNVYDIIDNNGNFKVFNQVLDKECQQVSEKVLVQDNVEDIKDIVMKDDVKDLPQDFVEDISKLSDLYMYGRLRKGDELFKVYTYLGNGVFYNRLTMIGYKIVL